MKSNVRTSGLSDFRTFRLIWLKRIYDKKFFQTRDQRLT